MVKSSRRWGGAASGSSLAASLSARVHPFGRTKRVSSPPSGPVPGEWIGMISSLLNAPIPGSVLSSFKTAWVAVSIVSSLIAAMSSFSHLSFTLFPPVGGSCGSPGGAPLTPAREVPLPSDAGGQASCVALASEAPEDGRGLLVGLTGGDVLCLDLQQQLREASGRKVANEAVFQPGSGALALIDTGALDLGLSSLSKGEDAVAYVRATSGFCGGFLLLARAVAATRTHSTCGPAISLSHGSAT